jgi:hypothetical protein
MTQDAKRTHKTRHKLTPALILTKATCGINEETKNKATRAEPPQQTKQAKCSNNKQSGKTNQHTLK